MKRESKPCNQCISACVQVEAMASQQAAIARYSRLFSRGLFPTLCQQEDGIFRICHTGEPQQAAAHWA